MKKGMLMLVMLTVGLMSLQAAEPLGRVTSGTITIAAGSTNGTQDAWLNTGDDVAVMTPSGAAKTGVGQVRACIYSASCGATNWSFFAYAYDAGVKKTLYSASGTTAVPTSGRYDLLSTNVVFSGRIRVEVFQGSYTNSASTWAWSAIVE